MKTSDFCYTHSLSSEDQSARLKRMQQRSVEVRKRNALARQHGTAKHRPDAVTLAIAMYALRELLTATLPDCDVNLEQRALGLELFAAVFRQPDRAAAFELLRRAAPNIARQLEPDLAAMRRFEGARDVLRRKVIDGEVELGELGGEIRELLTASAKGW